MNMTRLILRRVPSVPLEAELITPDVLDGLRNAEIRALPVFHGKRQYRLDDFFEVEGDGSAEIHLEGDLHRVRWVGHRMTRGRIVIHGNIGMHLGAHMQGGSIEVYGHASDWVGAEMTGGRIWVHGNVGNQVGAAYRGSPAGMRGGVILVDGSAGIELGMRMYRGVIAVRGPVGDFAGLHMHGGTLILLNAVGIRTGAWMARGTVLTFRPPALLPTFLYACTYRPTFSILYFRYLEQLGFSLPETVRTCMFRRYVGDTAVPGKGEILVAEFAGEME